MALIRAAAAAREAFQTARDDFYASYENKKIKVSDEVFKYINEMCIRDSAKTAAPILAAMAVPPFRIRGCAPSVRAGSALRLSLIHI